MQSTINPVLMRMQDRWYNLIPHEEQIRLVEDKVRFKVIPAGRRCLEEGTLVATPNGGVPIENLNIGDLVIGYEDNEPKLTTVAEVFNNGKKEVIELLSGGRKYLSATKDHKLLSCNESYYDERRPHLKEKNGYKKTPVSEITKRNRVKKAYCEHLIDGGEIDVDDAYLLAVFLGDGCSRDNKSSGDKVRNLYLSSDDDVIPNYISSSLNGKNKKSKGNNHTYCIELEEGAVNRISYYKEWCSNRYAHEKIANWDIINTWNKESCYKFLAGIIDTDGSIYYKTKSKKEAIIAVSMQSKSIVEVCKNIIFKYFQEEVTFYEDTREKYVNGNVWCLKTTSNIQLINIFKSINKYLVKKKDFDITSLSIRNVLPDRIGFKKGDVYTINTYDIRVSNRTNLYVLHKGGVVTSNSGKTERFKRFLAKQAMLNDHQKYFAAAPTHDQAKKIFWEDLKLLTGAASFSKKPSESDRIIFMPNETQIHVVGLDKPQRIEGINWTGGGIDEIADIKKEAWESNILPALNTVNPTRPNYRPWCWLLGVPDGLNHYYELAMYAQTSNDPDWGYYHWKSADILPHDVIESAKRQMSAKQYRQEYEASFETASGKIYEDYSKDNHTTRTIQPHEQLMWMHDQNYTPLSSAIGVRDGNDLYLLDEIVLTSAISKQSALEFVEKFKDHKNRKVLIYGDPAGRAGEKHGHASDYTDIEDVLRQNGWTFERRVKRKHPAIKDRQNAVRAKIKTADDKISLLVNPNTAKWCDKGLATVQLKEGSSFQEDQSNQYQHITTAIGYCIDYEWSINKDIFFTGIRSVM